MDWLMSMDKHSFERTFAALENLNATVLALHESVDKLCLKAQQSHETPIDAQKIDEAVQKIEQTIQKIDTVLNENG